MYGAGFDCGIEKTGNYHTIKFYLEAIEDQYLPQKEELTKQAMKLLLEIAFHPYVENGAFKEEYVKQEKENLKQIIEGKIDNKGSYALERCIEEMYKNKPYGLYKYGYIEDLEQISNTELYQYYLQMLQTCKIDIFASGASQESIEKTIKEFLRLDNPTPELMKVIINKIEVHQDKQIDIFFNFKKLQSLSKSRGKNLQ